MEVQDAVTKDVKVRNFTLRELAENYTEICKQIESAGQYVPEELEQMHHVAKSLLADRLDDVWLMKKQIEAHNEALKAQLDYNTKMLEDIDFFTSVVVAETNDKKIQGSSVSVRTQKNSRASVVIEDESKISDEYRVVEVTIKEKFPATETNKIEYWKSVVLGKVITNEADLTEEEKAKIEKAIVKSTSKSLIETALKDQKPVDGARLEYGSHLRWQVGKVKTKQIEAKNG